MNKIVYRGGITLVLLALLVFGCGAQSVIPGGNTIGLKMQTDGVAVVEFSSRVPQEAGLKRGDIICKIDGKKITTTGELTAAVEGSCGAPLKLTVSREGEERQVTLAPGQTAEGWRLGIYVRDSISGIGTVTYIDPQTGRFGALGHGISDGANLLPMKSGTVLPSQVASVIKGEKGKPGALQGAVQGRSTTVEILRNTNRGIFGTLTSASGETVEIAEAGEVHTGPAVIRSNVRGTEVEEFDVKICALYPNSTGGRNLLLEATDPDLLEVTGGIVQGMSGSPILQDGKLIGAVTHVLIEDPTRGYGIFIENMMSAAA